MDCIVINRWNFMKIIALSMQRLLLVTITFFEILSLSAVKTGFAQSVQLSPRESLHIKPVTVPGLPEAISCSVSSYTTVPTGDLY